MKHLFHAKWGKLLLFALLAGLVVTASASVYVFYYSNGTASVQTPDVQLIDGSDISGSCSAYPCASGSVSSTHDVMTVTISFFPASTGSSPVPATYYSNFAQVKNTAGSGTHTIQSVQIFNISGTTADLGAITVYYCTSQTEFTAAGAPATSCVGSFSITSGTGGSVSGSFPVSIGFGATQYIEIAAYAASGASASTSVTFQIAVQWV